MSGYLAQPREEWPIVDGWFHTGDLGRLDRDGFLYLAGRRSDMIIRGGENIFPAEAQTVLEQHPAVARVAVVGLPDARWGEIVAAAVVTVQGATVTDGELAEFCRGRLAGFKSPTRYTFVAELPTNSTGKVRPAAVRALFERAAGPDA
jgi:acyl-CoA synthetase (AMP-forming)/AMP-acid ligase II